MSTTKTIATTITTRIAMMMMTKPSKRTIDNNAIISYNIIMTICTALGEN
jgi:hypothetical protein